MKKVYSILSILLTIALIGTLVSCEKDQEVMLTAVSVTNEQITPMYNSATISSTISSEATIREVFVQYARTKDFAEYDEVSMQEIDGRYTAELLDLQDNTIYYYRYAASNRHSAIVLKTIHQFETLKPTVPTISLDTILTVWDSYAQVQITLSFDGGANVSEMGVCWGTNPEPTPEDNVLQTKDTVAVLNISSLEPNTQYYVRAYATNKIGVGYSQTYTFTTFALPQVQSNDITDVQLTSAMLNGLLVSDGNDTAVVVGFCWSENEEPTISDTLQIVEIKDNIFSYYLSSLKDETQYFVRAFAQNRIGVAYGEVKAFTTASTVIPTVLTTAATQVTTNSAVVGGNVTDDGGAEVTERGIVYSTTPNPTTANSKLTSGSGVGEFTCDLTDLQSNATYYARAYAINKKGVAYGEEVSFATNKQIVLPSVTTNAITQITETSAVAGGNVTSDGYASVTERGVVYSTNPNPVITNLYNTIKPCGSGTGSFTCDLTNLQPNTTYYVRAYATNSMGTAYGEEVSFTTEEEETVVSDPTGTENGYGYVDLGLSVKWATCNVGANSPEEYGDYFAWGETEPKEYYDWGTYKYCNGSSSTLTKYNTSSVSGTVDNKTQLELSDDAARANWGGSWRMPTDAELTELREQCTWTWTIQNGVYGYKVTSKKSGYTNKSIFLPAAGYRIVSSLSSAGSNGNYWSSSLDTDSPYRAWRVRFSSAYVDRNGYSRYCGFSVRPVLRESEEEVTDPTVTTAAITQITETTAVAGGNVTSDGNASVTERGVVYSTNPNPVITNLYNTIKPCGSGTGSFTCNLTNLQPNTTYYVRAYATNSMGTAYGEEVSFISKKENIDNPPSNLTAMPFSVSASKQVYFSKGNLQYHPANDEWRFAENQTDYIGDANSNCSLTYNGWLDLFGWSTSATNFGVSTSASVADYSGTFVDWGTNKIGNDAPNTWRTLTAAEWNYLTDTRANAADLCGVAQVNGVNGLIFLPDNWVCPAGMTFKSGFYSVSGVPFYAAYQTFTAEQWSKLESAGAVFLPAAGRRYSSNVVSEQDYGDYWSATENLSENVYCFFFHSDVAGMGYDSRYSGQSVRLVKD